MSPAVVGIITALISATAGVLAKGFLDSWQEKRRGRKDEAMRIAAERDRYRTLKFRWKKAYYQLVYIASKAGVPDDQLPHTPDDD